MPNVKILNVNGTDYTITDPVAQAAAQAAQQTADENKISITYDESSETLTIKGGHPNGRF